MSRQITVAILGATGYTALEAMKILLRHPDARIVAVTSRQEGRTPVSSVHPSLVGRLDLPLEDLGPEEVGSRAAAHRVPVRGGAISRPSMSRISQPATARFDACFEPT